MNDDKLYHLYNKILPAYIDTITAGKEGFYSMFLDTANLFASVLDLDDVKYCFAIFLVRNVFIDNKIEQSYFESPYYTQDEFQHVLDETNTMLFTKPEHAPVVITHEGFNGSVLITPICCSTDVYGYALVYYCGESVDPVDSVKIDFLAKVMRMASFVLERDHKEVMHKHYYTIDYLTALPNREYSYEMIIYLLQTSEFLATRFALLIVRINGIKNINNSLGIFTGDAILREMGVLVKEAVSDNGAELNPFIGRLGGGDFIVLIKCSDTEDDEKIISSCCDAIIEKTKNYIDINGYKLYSSVNIGVSIYPQHGATAEEMLRKADLAKSVAKQDKPNSYKLYTSCMDGDLERVMFLNNNLPSAITSNQFELFYQAQVNMETGLITCAESLIRWRHHEKGLIYPNYFISYAEENGYSIQIDLLVLNMACEQLIKWNDAGINLSVSVNISPIHFTDGLIYNTLKEILSKYRIDPAQLKIELLESALVDNFDVTVKVIKDIRQLGVDVALDDFGTGYCSLEYVAKLPVNYLKVDRMFSMNLNDNPSYKIILETIMTLSKGMKVKTIMEGVETQSQYEYMKKIGVDFAQGYYINKPLPVGEFEALLEKNRIKVY